MKGIKILRFVPLLVVMVAIFILTTQSVDGTMALSNKFGSFVVRFCNRLGIQSSWWNSSINVRRFGHIIEYGVLGVCAGIAFDKKVIALLLCLAVSVSDQTLKIFVPVRHFDVVDIGFDMIGSLIGVQLAVLISTLINRSKSL